jgi:hypothetical protein
MGKSSFDEMGYETDLLASRYLKKAKRSTYCQYIKGKKTFLHGSDRKLAL